MVDRFSLALSSFSIALAFIRIFIIQDKFSDFIFRNYVLLIIPLLILVELENIKFDLARRKKNNNNNSINLVLLILLSILGVYLFHYIYISIENGKLIIYTLLCGALIDGLISVNTASRSTNKNLYLLASKVFSLSILYFSNIYLYACTLVVFMFFLNNEINIRRDLIANDSFSRNTLIYFMISVGGRLKDLISTYFIQIVITGSEHYFYFYIYSKVLQNIAGFSYTYLRSTLKTDTTRLYLTCRNYIHFSYPAPILIYMINIFYSILFIPILALIENIVAQLILYSNKENIQINLVINNLFCSLLLSLLYFFKLNNNLIISYIGLCYIIGVSILCTNFQSLNKN